MLHLCYSNRLEALAEGLGADLELYRRRAGPLAPIQLVVPNRLLGEWIKHFLARRDGIAGGITLHLLRRFVASTLEQLLETPIASAQVMQDRLLATLLDDQALSRPELAPVRSWLSAAGDNADALDLRRVQLSAELATLFEEYAFSRPEMLSAWPRSTCLPPGPFSQTESWQRQLWLDLFGERGSLRRPGTSPREAFLPLTAALAAPLPHSRLESLGPVFFFGVSYMAVTFQRILARLAEGAELRLYTLNPCMEFWEDLPAGFELRRTLPRRAQRPDRSRLTDPDPFALTAPDGPPALSLWGRPGRENIRMLDTLSACDAHTLFLDPCAPKPSLLRQIQRDILLREPERHEPAPEFDFAADKSLQVLACAGVRRAAEEIAGEILAALRTHSTAEPLRFCDIGVLVASPEKETWLTHLASAFQETGPIPFSLIECSLAADSAVAQGLQLLLDLPLGSFSRAEVLRVVTHPCVTERFPDADPDEWIRCCDALGIVHGLDRADHQDTYIDRDILNWDQGLRRLALGSVMAGARSGESRAFALNDELYLPEERVGPTYAQLGLLLRSLLTDARFARTARMTVADWATFLDHYAQAYLTPRSPADEADLERCLRALRGLAEFQLDGREVSYRIARELVAPVISGTSSARQGTLGAGVTLGTLESLRTIPFRLLFVAGLDEGAFPAPDRRSALDLRLAQSRAGDVSPRERDQYLFLEALLSARDRLVLTYLNRDPLTGDAREPSLVVTELIRMIRRGYRPEDSPDTPLVRVQPLRRYDEQYFPSLFAKKDEGEGAAGRVDFPASANARREAQTLALRRELERQIQNATLPSGASPRLAPDLAALRQRLAPEDVQALNAHLGLVAAPAAASPFKSPMRISLSTLRAFLECPLQASARTLLGMAGDEEDLLEREDEPFASARLVSTQVLRESLLGVLTPAPEGGAPRLSAREHYRALADRELLLGRMPSGVFAQVEREEHEQVLENWSNLLPEAFGELPREVERLRFGGADEQALAETVLDPLVFEIPDPSGNSLRVEITGRTEAFLPGRTGSLILENRAAKAKDWEKVLQLRRALRAFLDRVALSAAGIEQTKPHSVFLCLSEPRLAVYHISPVTQDEARAYLQGLLSDLLSGVHAYFLPCEAVLLQRLMGKSLAEHVAQIVQDGRSYQSRYGPVPRPDRYPVPEPEEAQAMIERRFGLFFVKCLEFQPAVAGRVGAVGGR